MLKQLRAVFLSLLLASVAAAQSTTQSIQGIVTDSSGAVVAGARVTATELNTGVVRTVTTNETGNYTVPSIPVGNYDIKVEMQGFKADVITNTRVETAAQVRQNFTLEVGNVTETVEVSATPCFSIRRTLP